MKRRARLFISIATASAALVLLVVGIALAAAVTIDTFDYATQDLKAGPNAGDTGQGYASGSGILGNQRDIYIYNGSGGGDVVVQVDYGSTNQLAFSEGSNVTGTAQIQWDGTDNDATVISTTGLSGVDLTGGGTNDGFLVEVVFDDQAGGLTFKVYTGTKWSQSTITLPGDINADRMDVFFPFDSFTQGAGASGPAVFTDTGAVVIEIDGTLARALDVTIDLVEATAQREYGDLPSAYGTSVLTACHIPQTLRLGHNVDAEAVYSATVGAVGDDNSDYDDEDGVSRDMSDFWTPGSSVDLLVTVEGCSGTCYLNGWIDWSATDYTFGSGEQVFTDTNISDGANQIKSISIPTGYITGTDVYARFRLCDATGECDDVDNTDTNVTNGEIEDYFWPFGPNAVAITEFTAEPRVPAVVLAGVALLGVAAVSLFALTRRRKA